jgi:4-hydroxybenzoate polyprenyltransferase
MNTTGEEYLSVPKWRIATGFILKPYFNRVKLGEGGLVVFNLFHSIYAHNNLSVIITEVVLSFFVMCALYGFNDYTDRQKDGHNEKKDRNFIYTILQNEKLFIWLNLLLTITTILAALFFFTSSKMMVLLALYTINFLYSKRFKSVPVIDIVAVGIWGGLYVMVSGEFQWILIIVVGIMTSIAHLFQILTDKVSDGKTNTKTTVIALPGSEFLFLSSLCLLLGFFLFESLGFWWALSASFPILIYTFTRRVTLSWHVSRAYFFICWLALLPLYYGGLKIISIS